MTRQRFEGLRREAVRRFLVQGIEKYGKTQHTLDGKEIEIHIGRSLKMDRVDFKTATSNSYAECWESMKPLRDLVGM